MFLLSLLSKNCLVLLVRLWNYVVVTLTKIFDWRSKYLTQVIHRHVYPFKCQILAFTFHQRDTTELWNCWACCMIQWKIAVSQLLIISKLNSPHGVLQILLLMLESLFGRYELMFSIIRKINWSVISMMSEKLLPYKFLGLGDWQFHGYMAALFSCVIWIISLCYGISELSELPAIHEVSSRIISSH